MSKKKAIITSSIITLIIGLIYFYFVLPPINPQSFAFWIFVFVLAFVFMIAYSSFTTVVTLRTRTLPKLPLYVIGGIVGISLLIIIVNFILSPLFNAKSYAKRIVVNENANFTEDVAPVNFNALPLLDKDSSQRLGDKVMGQMPELVSQFEVSSLYTQINFNDKIMRVTPLEYASIIKYFTNRNEGVKGYITVNSVSGDTELVKLEQGMKYMPSALFFENLQRKLRLQYPTAIFGKEEFEIDNEGNPYWIVPVMKYTGVGLKRDVESVIILDPITGKSTKYKVVDVPTWVDHVYSADLLIEQVDDWGKYRGGFFNSIFGQKNVVKTTTGYNYTVMNDDVYLYTGVTSAAMDQSILGFILSNMRTKETKFYPAPGAEESSAMASAVGQVQQMNYKATFPLLINLNNKPTYLISLKDNAGLVKMYAFVDVEDYQKVVVTDVAEGIEVAAKNYLGGIEITNQDAITKEIKIASITSAMIDGTSYYYVTDQEGKQYKASIKINTDLFPFLHVNDTVTITYNKESAVTEITKIEKK